MKKLLIFFFINIILIKPSYSEILDMFCLIGKSDLEKAKLASSDLNRFAGKVIKFKIDFENNLVFDISNSSETSVITGINKIGSEFRKTTNGISFTNEQEVKGEKGKIIKYTYNNNLTISEDRRSGKLTSRVNQAGMSMENFIFSFFCRWYDYNDKEKELAKVASALPLGIDDTEPKRKKKSTIKKDDTNYDIVDLKTYKTSDLDSLLYLYKVKLFKNKKNKFIFLKNRNYLKFDRGQKLMFEDIKDLSERHFFGLPLHNREDSDNLKKLKKEYFKLKKEIS